MERNFGYHGQSKEVDGMMRVWMTNNSSLSLQGHLVPTNPLVTRTSSVDISRFVRRTTSSFLSNSSDKRKNGYHKERKGQGRSTCRKRYAALWRLLRGRARLSGY